MTFAAGPSASQTADDGTLKPFAEVFPPEATRHHFVGQDDAKGIYAKELHIPAGMTLVSHEHAYDHLSILASGSVWLAFPGPHPGGVSRRLHGPVAVAIRKGARHTVLAITDAVWFCIHPTDETDAGHVDDVIISQGTL
jgi:hypothetical protein